MTLAMWDIGSRAQSLLVPHRERDSFVSAIAVPSEGNRAVCGYEDGKVTVWQLDTGAELQRLSVHWGRVRGVAIIPGGRRAVSASADDTVKGGWRADGSSRASSRTARCRPAPLAPTG
jgi:WD40 repeat protein